MFPNALSDQPPILDVSRLGKKFPRSMGGSLMHGISGLFRVLTDRSDDAELFGDEFFALQNVTISVCRGEIVGIVGHNGSGKSTFLKLVAGITLPSTGVIRRGARVVPLFGIPSFVDEQIPLCEAIPMIGGLLGVDPRESHPLVPDIIDRSGIHADLRTPLSMLSPGMMVRLTLAIAAQVRPEILIMDEVTSALDAEFKRVVAHSIVDASRHGAVLIVSHDTSILRSVCTRIVQFDEGRLCRDSRNVAEALDEYEQAGMRAGDAGC